MTLLLTLLTIAGMAVSVVLYLRKSATVAADLRTAEATLADRDAHLAKLEAATVAQREQRLKGVDEKATAVAAANDPVAAAELLRRATSGQHP